MGVKEKRPQLRSVIQEMIKAELEKQGMTRMAMAEKLGWNPSQVTRALREGVDMKMGTVQTLVEKGLGMRLVIRVREKGGE